MDTSKVNFVKQGMMTRNIDYDDFIKYLANQKGY